MQQKWWLIAAGVVGIGLAVILFPRPDTGERIPEADMTNADPLNFQEPGQEKTEVSRPGPRSKAVKRGLTHRELTKGPMPMAQAGNRRKAAPEAIFAGRASGPWTIIRRQLILTETEEGKALADEIAPLVADLRSVRRDPMALDWEEVVARQLSMADRIRENETWMADETTQKSVDRLDSIFEEIEADQGE